MDSTITALPFTAALCAGMLICLEIGRRMGARALAQEPQLVNTHSSMAAAIFSLYGLLLAFTFSGAPSRLDTRRKLISDEANAIGTSYLRLDLLNPESQSALREQFRQYLDSRLAAYRKLPDVEAAEAELARSNRIQLQIWAQAVAATSSSTVHPEAGKLLLPALNEMFDIASTRTMTTRLHPPPIIFGLLFLLALLCSLIAGYATSISNQRSWLHVLAFTFVAVITVFVVLEIEFPRIGVLSVENRYDQVLVDLRDSMR